MSLLEDFLKKIQRRRSRKVRRTISVGFIKDAVIQNIDRMKLIDQEIVDVDIPGLTTDQVTVTFYIKEN